MSSRKSCLFCAPKLVYIFSGCIAVVVREGVGWEKREREREDEEIAHNFAVVLERTLLNVRANISRFPKWRAHKRKFSIDFPQTVVDNNDFRKIDLVVYSCFFSFFALSASTRYPFILPRWCLLLSLLLFAFHVLCHWRRTHPDKTSHRADEPRRTEPTSEERIRKITKSFCYILHFMFISSKTNLPTVSRTWKMSAWHRTTIRIANNNRREAKAKKKSEIISQKKQIVPFEALSAL